MRIRGRIPRRLIMASQQQAGKVLPLSSKVRISPRTQIPSLCSMLNLSAGGQSTAGLLGSC